jgi:hypothetical protein
MELSNELRNAVKLFEEGVVGAAFYTGRSAAEHVREAGSGRGKI